MALIALLAAVLLPAAVRVRKGIVTSSGGFSRRTQLRRFYRRLFAPVALALDAFASWPQRLPGGSVALANELATINEHGIESLLIDPASGNLPVATRYLLYTRGATGTGYCDICAAANLPLGPSSDAPYAVGDIVNVRRLGARPGLEIGIPASAFTVDDVVLTAAAGKVQSLATAVNGTYWVIGRAVKTTPATAIEIAYVPEAPFKVSVTGGTATASVA